MSGLFSFMLTLTMLIQAGCSSYIVRSPAQSELSYFNQAMSFKFVDHQEKESIENVAKNQLSHYSSEKHSRRIEFITSKSLPSDVAFQIELDIDQKNGHLIYRIYHAPKAFHDKASTYAMLDFAEKLVNGEILNTKFASFEIYYNAKNGDPIALDALIKWRLKDSYYSTAETADLFQTEEYKKTTKELEDVRKELATEIKKLKAKRSKDNSKRKIGLDALDKAPDKNQFRSMVARGDREGAANLLRKYLPWEDMAPFEKKFWESYLEIIVKPVPLSERILIYRGLDEDYIQRAVVKGKELTEKDAIEQSKAFIMSSVMVKNQGTWNRRLRSLEAMNQKFIATHNGSDEFAQAARITTMFLNHSTEPKGSPFLSFTPDYKVAEEFGYQRVSAYLLDPRLLNFNYASTFQHEIEFLIPLTTFPDELVGIADTELIPKEGTFYYRSAYLDEMLENKIRSEYGEKNKKEIIMKIKKNSYQFFKSEFGMMKDTTGKSPAASNLIFYKNFLTKDTPKPSLSPKGELNCKDLISLFWMVD